MVVINKVDRDTSRVSEVETEVFDLMVNRECNFFLPLHSQLLPRET